MKALFCRFMLERAYSLGLPTYRLMNKASRTGISEGGGRGKKFPPVLFSTFAQVLYIVVNEV